MGSIHAPALHILVMRAADGTPLLDAGVEKIRIDGAFEDECPLHETTDEDGIATFGDPPSGTFQILAHATGFLSGAATISLEPLREDPKGFTLALIEGEEGVAVETAGGRHVVTFFLREEATLNGRVIDDEGKPCEGLDVSILDGIPPLARVTCYGHRSWTSELDSIARRYIGRLQDERDRRLLREARGTWEDVFNSGRGRSRQQMQYLVFQTFEGFSVFTGRYQECRSRKRVLRTDENGEFKARNIRPGALATIAIFGTTSANEKIIPLAETMEIEGTGPHVREFRVERGCTIRCTLVLPEGEWSPEIRSEVDWGLVIPGRGKQLAYRYMQPASAEGEIVIGPFLESGQATLPVAVIRFNEARDRFIGRGEIPEMKKGVNHVVVELERPRVPEKPAGSVTVIAVRESGTILGIGAMREDVTGVVRDSRGKYMRTNVQGHSLQEFPCDSDGRIDLPISGYGPYTVGVLIGCAYHEIDRLHLAPGDELRFLFPEEKLLGLGSIEVSFTDEEGLPYAVLQASLWPAASDYPLMRQEMKSSMSFSHLRGGRYELKVFTRPRIVATPPACVDVKPREPVRVSIRVSPSTAVWGRFVGWTQPIADTPVFLSGVTRAGEVFQETALSDREGKFGFRAVPSGEFTCVASCAEGVLGPVNLSLDDLGKAPEIEMALDASRSSVEFRVRGAEGGQPGSLRFVEVLTDPGGKRVWLHPPDLQ